MKHCLVALSLILGVMFITPTPVAHAWSWSSFIAKFTGGSNKGSNGSYKWKYKGSARSGGSSVPELDPSAAGSALVLLLGGVAYVMSRRRDEDELA
ncbi:MAG: hypothetical protein WBG86_19830 [Polyangiales bacterium]